MTQTEIVHDDGHLTITQEGDPPDAVWHVDRPVERMQTFPARYYADRYCAAYHAVGGFREEKTGERGVPPAITRSVDDHVVMTYLAAQPSMGAAWVSRAWEIDQSEVRTAIELVEERAKREHDGF